MWAELRFAARTLPRNPGFALAAVGALALGIGANTAIFSAVNAVLLNPAGIHEPDRLVAVRCKYDKLNLKNIGVSATDFADARDSRQVFSGAAFMRLGNFAYTGGDLPERLVGAQVSWQWFELLGAQPLVGRGLRPEDDQPNANHVVILSHALWRRLFGADPGIVGRTIRLNDESYRVAGVTGPGFRWPQQSDLWTPLGLAPEEYGPGNRFNEGFFAVARLRPGVSFDQANAYMKVHAIQGIAEEGARGYALSSGWGMFLQPLTTYIAGDLRTPLLVLLGAVAFVLLIACSNIAGLMLARASGRARELAIRAALGASRWRLIRQTLAEAVILALCGTAVGLLLAYAGVRALAAVVPERIGGAIPISMDAYVLLFTAAAGVLSGLLFAIAPAWQASRVDRYAALKEGSRGGAGQVRQRLRSALVAGEVALAMVLLAGAGLFLRSLLRIQQVNTGFDAHGVMTGSLALPQPRFKEKEQQATYYRGVLDRLAALPGVQTAALGMPLPFSGDDWSASFQIEGREQGPGDPGPHGAVRYVSPGYFTALRVPLRRGRFFTDQDRLGSEPVAIIDENLAAQYWPNQDPIGKRLGRGRELARIVGVVGHVKHSELAADSGKGIYCFPLLQVPPPVAAVVVKTGGAPQALAGGIREAVPGVPVYDIKTMEERVAASLGPRQFAVTLLGLFAGIALLMAAVGLYALISYAVTQRTHEIGIRMALGAERSTVLAMVVWEGMRLAAVGALLGAAGAFALARLLASQLFEVRPLDPPAFAAATLALGAVALAASYLPARRATRVDPIVALRYE
jgi:predicted permease